MWSPHLKLPSPTTRRGTAIIAGNRVVVVAASLLLERHGGEPLAPALRPIRRQGAPRVAGVGVHVPDAAERADGLEDGVPVRVADLEHGEVGRVRGRGVPPLHPPPRPGGAEAVLQVLTVVVGGAVLEEPHDVPAG